jgi:ABC-type sugar transport system ATPase subunit
MPEVMSVADRVAARLGTRVARFKADDTTLEDLVAAMTGALVQRRQGRATPSRSCYAVKVVQVDLVGVDARTMSRA